MWKDREIKQESHWTGKQEILCIENTPVEQVPSQPLTQLARTDKKKKKEVPTVTTQVRRSTRATRYDGFKPKSVSDTKNGKSKVKPRKIPEKLDDAVNKDDVVNILPATPINVIQNIAVKLCGIDPTKITPKRLRLFRRKREKQKTNNLFIPFIVIMNLL